MLSPYFELLVGVVYLLWSAVIFTVNIEFGFNDDIIGAGVFINKLLREES